MEQVWEDQVALKNRAGTAFEVLGPAADYREGDTHTDWSGEGEALEIALQHDRSPLPVTKDREGYYGPWHFSYWASGLRDSRLLLEACARNGLKPRDYLDFGAATGRVVRHFASRPETQHINVYGCDINRRHVDWMMKYLPERVVAFQNHSIPSIPLPDESLDLVSAYSVFTHIEAFETTWLMELRRILRPGGLAWITVHTERTWLAMKEGWPLHTALSKHPDFAPYVDSRGDLHDERLVFRWRGDTSYSSNVFYTREYLYQTWGRIFEIVEDHHRHPGYQDVLVLRKR